SWGLGNLFRVTHRLFTPPVYRFLEAKYVNQFFDTGRLRISSFRRFSKHRDEQRRDTDESAGMVICGPMGGRQASAFVEPNEYTLVLSTTVLIDQQSFSGLSYDGCFRIDKTREFGLEVARCIPGVIEFAEGFCIYVEKRILHFDGP